MVSIIVPCYNQSHHLDEALQSVVEQTSTDWECIIVDDGSPDQTAEVANRWIKKDSRFKYLYKENGGLSSARNAGIKQAHGEFILPLDADDKISTNYVELAINAFRDDNTIKVVYCQAEKFGDEEGSWKLPSFLIRDLCFYNMIFCSAFFRKKDWESVGGYDENMIYGLEDWEFWIALLKKGGSVKHLEEIGFYYRISHNSMSKQLDAFKIQKSAEYLSIKHADFYVNQLGSFLSMYNENLQFRNDNRTKLKSKKYTVNLFCRTFFGFEVFKKFKTGL